MTVIVNSAKLQDLIFERELLVFLKKFGDEDVVLTDELIKSTPEIAWNLTLPFLLNDLNYEEFTKYEGEKLARLNADAIGLMIKCRENRQDYFSVHNKLNQDYENDRMKKCLELLERQS